MFGFWILECGNANEPRFFSQEPHLPQFYHLAQICSHMQMHETPKAIPNFLDDEDDAIMQSLLMAHTIHTVSVHIKFCIEHLEKFRMCMWRAPQINEYISQERRRDLYTYSSRMGPKLCLLIIGVRSSQASHFGNDPTLRQNLVSCKMRGRLNHIILHSNSLIFKIINPHSLQIS